MEYFKENIFSDKKRNQKYKQDKGLFWNKRINRMLCCRNQLLRKAFLSLLAILWYSAFKWVYISFSPLLFASFLFTDIFKASSDSHFAFLHFFFLGMVLIPVSCTMSWTSIHSSSGTLSVISSPLNLFLTSTVGLPFPSPMHESEKWKWSRSVVPDC